MTDKKIDWRATRQRLRDDQWLLAGREVRRTTYEAARAGRVTAMRGVLVVFRNSHRGPDGRVVGDLYLKLPKEGEVLGRVADGDIGWPTD